MLQQEIVFKELNPFQNFEDTKRIWQSIEQNAETNFYLSWFWMENWLKSLSEPESIEKVGVKGKTNNLNKDVNIIFIYAEKNAIPVFCYFLGLQTNIINKIIRTKRAYLNKVGDKKQDIITIEYNGILIDKYFAASGFTDVFKSSVKWDELIAQFVTPDQKKYFLKHNLYWNSRLEEDDKAFKIELDKVKQYNNDLLPLLSNNRRYQIRRTIKAYQQEGSIEYELSTTLDQKLNYFNDLKKMHQEHWQQKGRSGSFSYKYYTQFHERLIKNHYKKSRVEIFTLRCGKSPIGYLYFLIEGKNVYFYQSGFQYRDGNNFRPGLLSHYFAINHYAKLGFETYDFLVGDDDYKKSLSTEIYHMKSYRLRKNKIRFKLEDYIRKIFKQ